MATYESEKESRLPAATATTAGLTTSYAETVQSSVKEIANANYTILDNDGFSLIRSETTLTADRTIFLPLAANNKGRKVYIKKDDTGAFDLIVNGNGTEKVDGELTQFLTAIQGSMTLICDGDEWHILNIYESATYDPGAFTAKVSIGSPTIVTANFFRVGKMVTVFGKIDGCNPAASPASFEMALPIASNMTGTGDAAGTAADTGTTAPLVVYNILAIAANDTVRFITLDEPAGNHDISYHFSYIIK